MYIEYAPATYIHSRLVLVDRRVCFLPRIRSYVVALEFLPVPHLRLRLM